jgi:hypothetical protein
MPETCVSVAGTYDAPAPYASGSFSVSSLTKYYNMPANACVAMSGDWMSLVYGGTVSYTAKTAMAVSYNQITVPASCFGMEFKVDGGPVYTYVVADGQVNVGAGGANISGTANALVYIDVDNLTVTINGVNYVVDTGLTSMRAITTFNGNTNQTKVCMANGLPTTVNGNYFGVPANLWQCVVGAGQSNVTYSTDC